MESEESDYDEDVILPHSPLDEYLNSCEMTEDIRQSDVHTIHVKKQKPPEESLSISYFIVHSWQCILDFSRMIQNGIYSTLVPSFVPFYCHVLKNVVLKSARFKKVLVSKDLAVLLNYESEDELIKHPKVSTFPQQVIQLLGFVLICYILESSDAIHNANTEAIISDNLHFLCAGLKSMFWVGFKIGYLIIFCALCIIFLNVVEWATFLILWFFLNKKLSQSENVMKTIKKNLRLIQEAELIARGFTSASIPGIVERLELSSGLPMLSPERQYPELRKHVFSWTKQMFLLYRDSTRDLLKYLRFDPTKDFASEYLASLDIKEFGDFFRYNVESDLQELLRCSDNLSVSSLKTMSYLAELQISEFYKCLYLKISFANLLDNPYQAFYRSLQFLHFSSCLKQLRNKENRVEKETIKVYKYYRCYELPNDHEKTDSKNAQLSPFEINMHRMSLHLKSALKRLTDLEELYEDNQGLNHSKLFKRAEDMFKEIKFEVNAYEEYFEKCSNELKKLLYGQEENPLIERSEEVVEKAEHVGTNIVKCDDDPVIEDEIFEDVATKTCLEKDSGLQSYSEDCQKNMDTAGKLLHELKNILVVKANEHKAREQIALAKKNKNLINGLLSSESAVDNSYNEELVKSQNHDEKLLLTNEKCINNSPINEVCRSENIMLKDSTSMKNQHFMTEFNQKDEYVAAFGNDAVKNLVPVKITKNENQTTFAASIAAIALQRQQMLGTTDTLFSGGTSSDEESES